MESGHHGNLWLDLDALFLKPEGLRPFVSELAERLRDFRVDAICGPMTGGAFLAQLIASKLKSDFYYAERIVDHPGSGTPIFRYVIPNPLRPSLANKRIALVDDVVNAGSAIRSTSLDLQKCRAMPAVIGALLTLGDGAAQLGAELGTPVEAVAHLENTLWSPSECPLCASGIALQRAAQKGACL